MQLTNNNSQLTGNGVSLIILTKDAANLEEILSTFFQINTYPQFELIIMDQTSSETILPVIAKYAHKGFIRHLCCPENSLLHEKVRYPDYIFISTLEDIKKISQGTLPTRPSKSLGSTFSSKIKQSTYYRKLERLTSFDYSPNFRLALEQSEAKISHLCENHCGLHDDPLISIIMPTWNRADIINEPITSILEQKYQNFELIVCDDASTDNTQEVVMGFQDPRVQYHRLTKRGAAAARNFGLSKSKGTYIAYLDSDNLWHPAYLNVMLRVMADNQGRSVAYADYIQYKVKNGAIIKIESFERPQFSHEKLIEANFIDLNSFMHHRELFECFGGFSENLPRLQDYDLILRYTWLRDPIFVPCLLALYQRNENLGQISYVHKHDQTCEKQIQTTVENLFEKGLDLPETTVEKVTILSWDLCRNHFAKPFALAEALSRSFEVQLISFHFFGREVFEPLRNVNPDFETLYFPGEKFPGFQDSMNKALKAINSDVIYAVKPRMPSLGLALLANREKNIPLILEVNDLETVVNSPLNDCVHQEIQIEDVSIEDKELLNPYSDIWSRIIMPLARQLPVITTHNKNIDGLFDNKCVYMRNIKDENLYNPDQYDRNRVREDLGFSTTDRIILFGGMLRMHKGIFELAEIIQRLDDPRYKLIFAGSIPNPDQEKLMLKHGSDLVILPPQDRESMARINLAADLAIIWLNPEYKASHYQLPYKLTDALAMNTPVIANDISDMGDLGRQDYLRLVPFGDYEAMIGAIREVFEDEQKTKNMVQAGRRLYLRQFSYAAARGGMTFALNRLSKSTKNSYPVSHRFGSFYHSFISQF